jgi:hypothetical protein
MMRKDYIALQKDYNVLQGKEFDSREKLHNELNLRHALETKVNNLEDTVEIEHKKVKKVTELKE